MFRHVDKTNKSTFIKSLSKKLLRRVGLDVRLARSRKYHLHEYSYDYGWLSRFMHFEAMLRTIERTDGSIVECGVGPGRALFEFSVISTALDRTRHIYGYDTFDGLPDPISEDAAWNAHKGGFFSYSQEHVNDELLLAGLDQEFISTNITLVPGDFSQTLPRYRGGPIAFLHIDADIYVSYKVALESLYDHVVPGGIIAFDEYLDAQWPGATKAVDEFFAGRPEAIVKSSVTDKYYVLKK